MLPSFGNPISQLVSSPASVSNHCNIINGVLSAHIGIIHKSSMHMHYCVQQPSVHLSDDSSACSTLPARRSTSRMYILCMSLMVISSDPPQSHVLCCISFKARLLLKPLSPQPAIPSHLLNQLIDWSPFCISLREVTSLAAYLSQCLLGKPLPVIFLVD